MKLVMFVFFRTRNSAETAHLTFFDSCGRVRGLNEHTGICGKLLQILTNNNHNFFLQNILELGHLLFQASNISGVSSSESKCHSCNRRMGVRNKVTLFNLHLPITLLCT